MKNNNERQTKRDMKKKRRKRKEGKKREKEQKRKESRLTTRIISMQLYNYNTFVYQADVINKGDKQGVSVFRLRLITGYDKFKDLLYSTGEVGRRWAALGQRERTSGNLNGRIVEK